MKDVSQKQKTSNNSNDFRRLNSLLHRTLSNTKYKYKFHIQNSNTNTDIFQ